MAKLAIRQLINFNAGPAYIPDEVNTRLIQTLTNRLDSGHSILEISHRSVTFIEIYNQLIEKISRILNIPSNYSILFMPGGARGQNAAIAMNMSSLSKTKPVYLTTGYWSKQSTLEAIKYIDITEINLSNYNLFDSNAPYYFYVNNETIDGLYFANENINHPNIVCDMTSSLFALNEDIEKFGAIFASSQKNLGFPGMTVLIIKNSILEKIKPLEITPSILNYKMQFDQGSMYNTPSNICWLTALYMLDWMSSQGIETIRESIAYKAYKIYEFLDNSKIFKSRVSAKLRSKVNIVFNTHDVETDKSCINYLKEKNIIGVNNHKALGGMRISLYVANYNFDCDYLINCLYEFEKSVV
jgi:phosphoserine aminotransferase